MELLGVLLTTVLVPGFVASLVAEWRSRASETRTATRDANLRRLAETRQLYLTNFRWFVDQRQRSWKGTLAGPIFQHTYGDISLVGDQEVVQQVAHFVHRVLLVRDSGPMSGEEESAYLNLNRGVLRALDEQEERAIRHQPLKSASWEMADARARAYVEDNPDGKPRMRFETARRAGM